jgi:2-haloacid dehalogenase
VTKTVVFDAYGTLFDVQSVATATEAAFPGYGAYITQIWRMKQLEYSWLRSMMGKHVDFRCITADALAYALGTLGLKNIPDRMAALVDAFDHLSPYQDTEACLTGLRAHRLVILSNGTGEMLETLVRSSGFSNNFAEIISVQEAGVYKPHPAAYRLLERKLGVQSNDIVFVSSNGFDIAGAKEFGLRVVRVERVTKDFLARNLINASAINFGPTELYQAMRTQVETLGCEPDYTIHALNELPKLIEQMPAKDMEHV